MNYSFCCLLMVQFSPGLSETRQKWAEAGIRSLTSHGHHTALHPWHVPGAREDRGGWTGRGQVKISIYWLCSQNLVVWWNAFVSREINLVSQSCQSPGSVSRFQLVTRILSRVAPVHSPLCWPGPLWPVFIYIFTPGLGTSGRGSGDGNLNIEPGAIRLW